jgi:hypothetical protein
VEVRVNPSGSLAGSGRGSDCFDLNDIEVGISLVDLVDAVIQIRTFPNGNELNLVCLPVLEDQIERKHWSAPY